MRERFRELDGLRGVAAVAVVWSHLTLDFSNRYPDDPATPVLVPWGAYGVQLFFLISGFVILLTARRATRPSDFVISRVTRLYPVYWVALTVSIIVSVVFAVPHTDIGWPARIVNYTMVQRLLLVPAVDGVSWTLAIEMQFYVLILALLLLTRMRLTAKVVVVTAACWCALSLVLSLALGGWSRGLDPQLVITPVKIVLNLVLVEWGPFFATGMLAFLARHDARLRAPAIAAAAVTVAVSGILHGWEQAAWVAVIVAVFLLVTQRRSTPVLMWAPVQWYGKISYSLYIGHLVTGTALMHLIIPFTGRIAAMLLTFAAVTLYAALLHRVGEVALTRRARSFLEDLRKRWDRRAARRIERA